MARSRSLFLSFAALCFSLSCDRAQQYPAIVKDRPQKEIADEVPFELSWREPRPQLEGRDLPIVFVPSSQEEEWQRLSAYWNHFPPLAAGMRTAHLGLQPLEALTAIVLTEYAECVKIKVPLGLPDPKANIPAANPPAFARWRLGKDLFFERLLKAGDDYFSCASCHDPRQAFADGSRTALGGPHNTLSLVNVVYNRRQFWDGRVKTLEETLVRSLDDERRVDARQSKERGAEHHIWGGFVRALVERGHYNPKFHVIFGVDLPTQDTVARALATYMRTILAGDSLFDRAEKIQRTKKAPELSSEHFEAALDARSAEHLQDDYSREWKRAEMPAMLMKGYALFQGKARCATCHSGPLFTDQDYHNVGYPDVEGLPSTVGKETGRSLHVPIGQKESRYVGAFRTPTLRNLIGTAPYFHHGTLPTLRTVVNFYDRGIMPTPHLAEVLKAGNQELRLHLGEEEIDALVMFLRSLEGQPLDPNVTAAPE